MEFNFKFFNGKKIKDRVKSYVMGIDVGGTNTNIGIAGIVNSKPYLLYSLNFDSKQLKSVIPAIKETLNYSIETFDILPEIACIGAAGVVSADSKYAELTNLEWNIDSNVIIKETNLKSLHIINDFQSIGYGINLLDEKNENDIINLKPELENDKYSSFTKVIIGAGTGLGKSILRYDDSFRAHIPIPSEGGHTDFPIHNNFDMDLVNFIKKFRGISKPIIYEEILSGRGLESIFHFLKKSKKYKETEYTKHVSEAVEKAPIISKYKELDETCKETFVLFSRYYARCAKNFVLDTLARGGLYIAGGIAAKNKEIFTSDDFRSEFENVYRKNNILKEVPIKIIVNYDVGLYGACYAAMYKFLKKDNFY